MTSNETVNSTYIESLNDLDKLLVKCSNLSNALAGIQVPHIKHKFASFLFTSLCTKTFSLICILPKSRFTQKTIDHWDYASVCSLTRVILECYFMFYYLCVEVVEEEEWYCRWYLLDLHDYISRIKLFDEPVLGDTKDTIEKLKHKLLANAYFTSLTEKRRHELLKGKDTYLLDKYEIAKRIGYEDDNFRFIYQFLSSATHTSPLTFYRMNEQERGRGVHSLVEETYIKLCIDWVIDILLKASDEMEQLFVNLIKTKN